MANSIYESSPASGTCLRQGEILSEVSKYRLDPSCFGQSEIRVLRVSYAYAVVLSQACDLEQDFNGRVQGKSQLPEILLCQLNLAVDLKSACGGSDIWKRIRQNKDERYHFLEQIPPEADLAAEGIDELGVDFKRYFTLPTDEVYQQIENGVAKRRSSLCTPYLEHLSTRFAYFLSRVALPRDHVSV